MISLPRKSLLPVSMTGNESCMSLPSLRPSVAFMHIVTTYRETIEGGKRRNQEDRFAVAIVIHSVDNNNTTVGHLPSEFGIPIIRTFHKLEQIR